MTRLSQIPIVHAPAANIMAPVDAYPLSLQLVKDFALQVRLYSVFDPPNLVIWTILKDEKLTGKLNVYSVHPDMEDKYPHCLPTAC